MICRLRQTFAKYRTSAVTQGNVMLAPPPSVKGMTVLDRNAFQRKISFPSLLVPVEAIKQCKKLLKSKLPSLNMKTVINPPDGSKGYKMFLLDPDKTFLEDEMKILESHGVVNKVCYHDIEIGYDHYRVRDIMDAIIPKDPSSVEGSASPAGFSTIGHIVHLNLREHQLPFKKIIGQVFLDKVVNARTVVHKIQNIDNEYRNLEMEVLAGEDNFITRVVEYNRIFEFDFSKVFWNPRLSTEHHRITGIISKKEIVFDVCAGVGPFAIPLARKGCRVFANDLNLASVKWLEHNATLNKTKMKISNLDGRAFIQNELKKFLMNKQASTTDKVHILMNLPGIAVEFLDAFPNLLPFQESLPSVVVHVYLFCQKDDQDEIKSRIRKHLGHPLPLDATIHHVRNVAPNKDQYCISFVVSHEVLCGSRHDEGPERKKLREE
ncbi:unnamed protein product [Clavelina lepadiformis]|uniref:tRNA (guanine(37)-N1)-methyltransferase n=1 Tax=Clavelina lepadiformis TaxID=159417 RepID=A0ABP0GRU8_CLALP